MKALREFSAADRVAARLEISSGGWLRGAAAGVDVMGDGSVVAFTGGVRREPLERRDGETALEAVAARARRLGVAVARQSQRSEGHKRTAISEGIGAIVAAMPELLRSTSTPRMRFAEVRLAEVAERQFGVVSSAPALGIRVQRCRDHPLGRGQAPAPHPPGRLRRRPHEPSRSVAASSPRCSTQAPAPPSATRPPPGGGSILAHEPTRIHVSTPRRLASLTEIRVHHRPSLTRERTSSLPVTPVPQTLLDLAATQPFSRAPPSPRRSRLPQAPRPIGRRSRARPRPSQDRRRSAEPSPSLPRAGAHAQPALEVRFIELVENADLPMPEINASRRRPQGRRPVARGEARRRARRPRRPRPSRCRRARSRTASFASVPTASQCCATPGSKCDARVETRVE